MTTPASNSTRRMTGGMALAEMLKLHGVGPMFGMGGFQLLPFYEACRALNLKHYLINDERCGAFAADAYAKVTNRPGVVDATLGPGATNLVTGIVESLNAGLPMIVITGNANREHATKNMTQETRQIEILRPIVKDVIRVEVLRRVPEHVRRAFAVATIGPSRTRAHRRARGHRARRDGFRCQRLLGRSRHAESASATLTP